MRGLLERPKIVSKQEVKNTQPKNLGAWQSPFQIHSPQLLLPGLSSNTSHKKLPFKKLLRQENAEPIPFLGTILATKTGCCKQRLQGTTHTPASSVVTFSLVSWSHQEQLLNFSRKPF